MMQNAGLGVRGIRVVGRMQALENELHANAHVLGHGGEIEARSLGVARILVAERDTTDLRQIGQNLVDLGRLAGIGSP